MIRNFSQESSTITIFVFVLCSMNMKPMHSWLCHVSARNVVWGAPVSCKSAPWSMLVGLWSIGGHQGPAVLVILGNTQLVNIAAQSWSETIEARLTRDISSWDQSMLTPYLFYQLTSCMKGLIHFWIISEFLITIISDNLL